MSIVPLGQTYVVANFKETQVGRLRIGQPVEIHADAFGDAVIRGQVESFAPATGSEFALIRWRTRSATSPRWSSACRSGSP
jgi:membrane fusion protein (multidrug efflux system)